MINASAFLSDSSHYNDCSSSSLQSILNTLINAISYKNKNVSVACSFSGQRKLQVSSDCGTKVGILASAQLFSPNLHQINQTQNELLVALDSLQSSSLCSSSITESTTELAIISIDTTTGSTQVVNPCSDGIPWAQTIKSSLSTATNASLVECAQPYPPPSSTSSSSAFPWWVIVAGVGGALLLCFILALLLIRRKKKKAEEGVKERSEGPRVVAVDETGNVTWTRNPLVSHASLGGSALCGPADVLPFSKNHLVNENYVGRSPDFRAKKQGAEDIDKRDDPPHKESGRMIWMSLSPKDSPATPGAISQDRGLRSGKGRVLENELDVDEEEDAKHVGIKEPLSAISQDRGLRSGKGRVPESELNVDEDATKHVGIKEPLSAISQDRGLRSWKGRVPESELNVDEEDVRKQVGIKEPVAAPSAFLQGRGLRLGFFAGKTHVPENELDVDEEDLTEQTSQSKGDVNTIPIIQPSLARKSLPNRVHPVLDTNQHQISSQRSTPRDLTQTLLEYSKSVAARVEARDKQPRTRVTFAGSHDVTTSPLLVSPKFTEEDSPRPSAYASRYLNPAIKQRESNAKTKVADGSITASEPVSPAPVLQVSAGSSPRARVSLSDNLEPSRSPPSPLPRPTVVAPLGRSSSLGRSASVSRSLNSTTKRRESLTQLNLSRTSQAATGDSGHISAQSSYHTAVEDYDHDDDDDGYIPSLATVAWGSSSPSSLPPRPTVVASLGRSLTPAMKRKDNPEIADDRETATNEVSPPLFSRVSVGSRTRVSFRGELDPSSSPPSPPPRPTVVAPLGRSSSHGRSVSVGRSLNPLARTSRRSLPGECFSSDDDDDVELGLL